MARGSQTIPITSPSDQGPELSTQTAGRLTPTHDAHGNELEYSAALELRRSGWTPPAGLSFSAMSLPRLPLVSVLNFLAFAADNPPPGMSNLMCAAHRLRAFRALCAAATDGKVKLFGRPRAGGARQGIDPIEFDQPLSLTAEDGAIGFDLDAMTMERFVELRREPNHWLWRDVYVDRSSLVSWYKKLLGDARRRAKARGVSECKKWLVDLRHSGPQEQRKEDYCAKATNRFGVGPHQFKIAWKRAEIEAPNNEWSKPGAPKKKSDD